MKDDSPSILDTVDVNRTISSEEHCLVGTGDVDLLDDAFVEVRLEVHLIAFRHKVSWQPVVGWDSCGVGGSCVDWTRRRIHLRNFVIVDDDQGDNAYNGRGSQDDKDGGESLGSIRFNRHRGSPLSVSEVLLLDGKR